MAKTQETLDLEDALQRQCTRKREYGCTEVTIGFQHDGHGDEIVDFMSMDSDGVFKCYELKVTLSDLKSDAKKSWYGDYNYLVVSEELWKRAPAWDNYIPPYVGILAGIGLSAKRRAKKVSVSDEQREMLRDSLIRSMFWRMDQLRENSDDRRFAHFSEQLEEQRQAIEELSRKYERRVWELEDYEAYYRKNHQIPSFNVAEQAKAERKQYRKRAKEGFTWKTVRGKCVCPVCGKPPLLMDEKPVLSDYCPWCGADLRKISNEEDPA